METITNDIFQIDSELVHAAFKRKNYHIEFNEQSKNNKCAVYFSSHNIYYPNTEESFNDNLIKKDRYEWFGNRIKNAYKHIFLRDIKKQWYLTGINDNINTPSALTSFLLNETEGFEVVAIGSSAGGYAATIYGQQLKAQRIYSFNAQYELSSLLEKSNEHTDPIVFRNANNPNLRTYYNAKNFITKPQSIFYFYSNKSNLDIPQFHFIKDVGIHILSFNTGFHGIPILKCNLQAVLSMSEEELNKLEIRKHNPIIFSIKTVGIIETVKGFYKQIKEKISK